VLTAAKLLGEERSPKSMQKRLSVKMDNLFYYLKRL
jgi:hypothetical protein